MFKIQDEDDQWTKSDSYVYSFENLLSKQPPAEGMSSNDKTLIWTLKVNSAGSINLPGNIQITDILPEGLKFVEATSNRSDIRISVDSQTDSKKPVITIIDPLDNKELTISIKTEVTDQLTAASAKTYQNQAVLKIGEKNYGTAQAVYTLGYKILEKTGLFRKYGFVDYTIKINEVRDQLVASGHSTSNNPLYIIDHMGDNMRLDKDSLKITYSAKTGNNSYAPFIEYKDYKLSKGTSDQDFVISNLPDKAAIVIQYTVSLTDPEGETTITNSADLYYDFLIASDGGEPQKFVIMGSDTEKIFKYKIEEVIPDDAVTNMNNQKVSGGIIYDDSKYWVTVKVTCDAQTGKLVAETTVSKEENGKGSSYQDTSIHLKIVI